MRERSPECLLQPLHKCLECHLVLAFFILYTDSTTLLSELGFSQLSSAQRWYTKISQCFLINTKKKHSQWHLKSANKGPGSRKNWFNWGYVTEWTKKNAGHVYVLSFKASGLGRQVFTCLLVDIVTHSEEIKRQRILLRERKSFWFYVLLIHKLELQALALEVKDGLKAN